MKTQKSTMSVRTLALVGVLSALVFALSLISFPVPILGDNSRIHLGNMMCLLGGMLFGPLAGGVSAGLGSMIYDFTNPLYISEFWITFITKFAMGFVAGLLAKKLEQKPAGLRLVTSAVAGQLVYIVLYLIKSALMQHFVDGVAWAGVWPVVTGKAATSGINGAIAVVASVILCPVLHGALKAAGLFGKKSA